MSILGSIAFLLQQRTQQPPSPTANTGVVAVDLSDVFLVINAFCAAVSAGAAVWAVRVAARSASNARDGQREERAASLYDRMILEPCLKLIEEFIREASEAVDRGQEEVRHLCATAPLHAAVITQVQQIIKTFNVPLYRAKTLIRGAVIGWGDDSLSRSVTQAFENLQDDASIAVGRLAGDEASHPREPLSNVVVESAARVTRLFASYDPCSRHTGKQQ